MADAPPPFCCGLRSPGGLWSLPPSPLDIINLRFALFIAQMTSSVFNHSCAGWRIPKKQYGALETYFGVKFGLKSQFCWISENSGFLICRKGAQEILLWGKCKLPRPGPSPGPKMLVRSARALLASTCLHTCWQWAVNWLCCYELCMVLRAWLQESRGWSGGSTSGRGWDGCGAAERPRDRDWACCMQTTLEASRVLALGLPLAE